jgi:hypothetical protein
MVLTADQIKHFILNPQNKEIIDFQVKLKEKHELHIAGLGIDKFIEKVDHIENEAYLEVKKNLKNTITVKAFEKVLRPKDKILTAKGGTVIYEFDQENDKESEQILKKTLEDLNYNGHSLKSYTETIWLDYGIWVDPMGITLVEYLYEDTEIFFNGEQTTVKEKTDKIKIDYISIYERINGKIFVNVHDFEYKSFNQIEYLILNEGTLIKQVDDKEKKYKVYRVIDDEKDELWLQDQDEPEDIQLKLLSSIYHGFGKVPALFNSNRVDKKSINKWFTTYCAEALIVAKDYLNDYIDFRIYKKKLGIPRLWEFKVTCRRCNGAGEIENLLNDGGYDEGKRYSTCPSCKGERHDKERVLTDITQLDILSGEFQSNIPPSGAVTLPTEIQEQLRKELDEMEFDLAEVVWGQGSAVDKERKNTTAFEISVRNEGKIDKLRAIEKNKVLWQSTIINIIGKTIFPNKFTGVIITPATQFIVLTPTESRQVYLESKKADSSEPQLTKLWIDYLNAEYESDPISFERQIIIMLLTPMFHFDLLEAWDKLTPQERLIKKNLDKYIYRYETDEGSILISKKDPKKLQEIYDKFLEYANEEIQKNKDDGTSIQQNAEQPPDIQ